MPVMPGYGLSRGPWRCPVPRQGWGPREQKEQARAPRRQRKSCRQSLGAGREELCPHPSLSPSCLEAVCCQLAGPSLWGGCRVQAVLRTQALGSPYPGRSCLVFVPLENVSSVYCCVAGPCVVLGWQARSLVSILQQQDWKALSASILPVSAAHCGLGSPGELGREVCSLPMEGFRGTVIGWGTEAC